MKVVADALSRLKSSSAASKYDGQWPPRFSMTEWPSDCDLLACGGRIMQVAPGVEMLEIPAMLVIVSGRP
jgi:hypothetical protein